ncbi:MAG: dihydroneopterin aldolase [Alphaproteobacteria bacterium]|nr:MAG: dihydroneopterin aldolase [Alphaproteobacteria bacterium]
MSNIHYPARLGVHRLRLTPHLGYGEAERAVPQAIEVSVDLYLPQLPEACARDDGAFLCYHQLADVIKEVAYAQPYALIEYMAMRICAAIDAWLEHHAPLAGVRDVRYCFHLAKVQAAVPDLLGGSSFTYSTLPQGVPQ